jgi:hypothetical protein
MSVLDALANEGEPLPIGGPLRKVVAKALGGCVIWLTWLPSRFIAKIADWG